MANMSYCRFQNTRGDLQDCVVALYDREPLSADEAKAAKALAALCEEYLSTYDPDRVVVECANCGEPNYDGGKVCRECREEEETD